MGACTDTLYSVRRPQGLRETFLAAGGSPGTKMRMCHICVSCNDRVSVGYKYKVRIKLSGEGIKTIQVVQTEDGEWYFVSK